MIRGFYSLCKFLFKIRTYWKLSYKSTGQFQNFLIQLQGRLTASTVGQIVGLQSDEIKQIVSEYAEKVSVLPEWV